MSKTQLILVALALLQVIILSFSGGGSTVSTEGVSEPGAKPFEGLDRDKVMALEIVDEDNERIVVTRQKGEGEEPDTWGVTTVSGFPVRSDKPGKMLDDLEKTILGRVLTRKPENLARLEVADERFARHIVVKGEGGSTLADFYIGEGASYDEVHFRRAGESVAYNATGLSTFSFGTDVGSWVDTQFTDIDDKAVTKLELIRDGDLLVLEKKTREKKAPAKDEGSGTDSQPSEKKEAETETYWVVAAPEAEAGKELEMTKVETLLRGFCRIYLATALGKVGEGDHGFDAPTAKAVIHIPDQEPQTITVGKKRESEGDFATMRTGFDYVVTLREYTVDDYFKKPLKDLLPEEKKEEDGGDGK